MRHRWHDRAGRAAGNVCGGGRSRSAVTPNWPAEPFVGRIVIDPTTTTSNRIHATPGWTAVRPRPANSSPPICPVRPCQGVQHHLVPARLLRKGAGPAAAQRLAIPIGERRPAAKQLVTALADERGFRAGGQRHPRRQPPQEYGTRYSPAVGPEEAIALARQAIVHIAWTSGAPSRARTSMRAVEISIQPAL